MDDKMVELFTVFRPFCAGLATKPCQENLEKLSRLVVKSDVQTLEVLQEWILFPCQLYLRTPVLPENFTINVIEFVKLFFNRSEHENVQLSSSFLLLDVLQSLMKIATEKPSEDLKISTCKCLTVMLKNSSLEVRNNLYGKEQKLTVSHLVFTLLEWSSERISSLTSSSFELLSELCPKRSSKTETSNMFIMQFSQMLPGITTKVVNLLLTKNQDLKTMKSALQIWSIFVTFIFNDSNFERFEKLTIISDSVLDESENISLFTHPKMIQAARDHLFNHLSVFGELVFNCKDLSIRKDYLNVCIVLIDHCGKIALVNCRTLLIEHLSSLAADQNCKETAEDTLKKFLGEIKNDKSIISADSLTDNPLQCVADQAQMEIFDLCEKCRRKVDGFTLIKLLGYLNLLKEVEDYSIFFQSETYLGKLMETILGLSELEEPDICPFFVGEIESLDQVNFLFNDEALFEPLSVKFKHEVVQEYSSEFTMIIHTLAKYSNLHFLVDFLVEKLNAATNSEAEAIIFILNQVLKGILKEIEYLDHHSVKSVVEKLMDVYLNIEENLCSKNGNVRSSMIGIRITEGFGHIFAVTQKGLREDNFAQNYMSLVLPRILLSFDGLQPWAATVLVECLTKLKQSFSYATISMMMLDYFPSLCCNLSLLLRRYLTSKSNSTYRPPGLRFFLVVVLQLNNLLTKEKCISSDSDLSDVMLVLLNHLDVTWMNPDKSLTLEVLKIIAIFVESLKLASVKEENIGKASLKTNPDEESLTKLIKGLKEVDTLISEDDIEFEKCPPEGFHQTLEPEKEDEEVDLNDKVSEKQIHFLQKCIEHCRHYISMVSYPQWQVTALDVVTMALQSFEVDRDTLLPLIHQSWQPLKLLFESDNINVVAKAFSALHVMAKLGKDFIHRRTVNDVLPSIMKYIVNLKAMVEDKRFSTTRISKKSWKLLEEMTKGLWEFMALLELSEFEVDPIIENMMEFSETMKNCKNCHYKLDLEPLSRMNEDVLWLKLQPIDNI